MPTKFGLVQSLGATFARLTKVEKLIFVYQIGLSYLVGLFDLGGILVFGSLALVATGGNPPEFLEWVGSFFGVQANDKPAEIAFFAFIAMVIFLAKGLLSMWVTAYRANSLARLEKLKMRDYASALISHPQSRKNSFAEPEVAHALTVGLSALFSRTLGHLGIVISEFLAVMSIIVLLAIYSPAVTLLAAIYFALVGFVLQGVLGLKVERESDRHARAQVLSGRFLREALYLFPELKLSGRLGNYLSKFEEARTQALEALSKTLYLTAVPRYVVEGAFMVGAFGLAFFLFQENDFASAVATFSVFIASGSRIAPALITLMNSFTALRQVMPEVNQTLKVLKEIE